MKRLLLILLVLTTLCLMLPAAAESPLGWGFVNASDVALRREMGGKVLTRLPENTCVWINGSATDKNGVTWYNIRTGLHTGNANYDFSGWMMASFIDAGEAIWHDVTAIATGNHGLIALRADGSTETAGRPVVAMDGSGWVSPRGWSAPYGSAVRVGVPHTGNEYFIVTEEGAFVSSVNGLPDASGHRRADALEAAEPVILGEPFPGWCSDADTVLIRSAGLPDLANPTRGLPVCVYIALRADGSLLAEPAAIASLLSGWADMKDIRLCSTWVMGLRRDGTVRLVSLQGAAVPDVSHWHNIVAIGLGNDWCVGLLADGTLVFAGDHVFMDEGHTRE